MCMKQFKKRTLALVLASVVTVVGAFGAENYKNSLMSLKFNAGTGGSVEAVLYTKDKVTNNISPIRRGVDTYVIMLPETNSEIPSEVELGANVQSLDIQTMPYTTSNSGYTKITIKTKNNAPLSVKTALYITQRTEEQNYIETQLPSQQEENKALNSVEEGSENVVNSSNSESVSASSAVSESRNRLGSDSQTSSVSIDESLKQFQYSKEQNSPKKKRTIKKAKKLDELREKEKSFGHQELVYMILGVAFVIATSIFLLLKAKEKLVEVTGERADYDVSDEPKPVAKKKETQKINTTIKNLDRRYTSPMTMPVRKEEDLVAEKEPEEPQKVQEVENVVDLDELLQSYTKPEAPVNEALEDFLSSYDFEKEESANDTEQQGINEELYDKCLNKENIEFSQDDVERIGTLMSSEISDDTIRNVSNFLDSSDKNKKVSPLEILEKLVTTYTLERNISFTTEDVKALYKLINVEIDADFINDLRTNPSRMQEMREEIARQKSKPHKTSELLTLNVKDMLPDLSEALKKQGGKRIESEVRPQVVYASEGYDVSTLKLNMDLPDLSKEINNEDAYKSRPSDAIQYVDTNYEVEKMSISNELPDLEDVLKHPEKYETPEPEEVEVDEEALLRNISNVTFKPFDDGTREFEVLNDVGPAPTVSDMQAEFDQFGNNFEIVNNEDEVLDVKESDKNDFETLYDGKYVDFDKDKGGVNSSGESLSEGSEKSDVDSLVEAKNENLEVSESNKLSSNDNVVASVENPDLVAGNNSTEADELLKQIRAFKDKRRAKSEERKELNISSVATEQKKIKTPEFCVFEGEKYSVVSASYFTEQMGCYLVKNNKGYCIIGFVGDHTFKIKHYEKLETEKLQSRLSEKLEDGTVRYIVRIGIHKFILNVKQDDMEFVMDLC